jgi:hypothetical protein
MSAVDNAFLNSLTLSQLENLLGSHSKADSLLTWDEKTYDRERKAKKRAAERDLRIPLPKDIARRIASLESPEAFLTTYFSNVFFEAFTQDRRDMMESIIQAAIYGGDQAIAGPRGEGKTRLAIYTALFLMVKGLSPFPLIIGKSQGKSQNELKSIREKLQQAEEFRADFPEIGVPFQAVGGWSSRARMQTVMGESTNIELAADHLIFPTIGLHQLPGWPDEIEPVSKGQIIASLGVDGPVRGTNYRDKRPTIAILDDIEDREAAASEILTAKNEDIIEQDIAGLGASAQRVSRVMLCTIQNRRCIAYKYTDPKLKPSWRGRRYRKMIKPPDRMDLVEEYIDSRKGHASDDPDARVAFRFWRDNQATIEAGCVVSNINSYDKRLHADGETLELSAIHAYYNRVADVGPKAVATEIDNDPPEESGPMGNGLTPVLVASRLSGLERRQLPANTIALTAAIDLGKYRCHWVVIAWWAGGGGTIVDYGIAEVTGTDKVMNHEASEPNIYKALLQWRDELIAKEFTDATGTNRTLDMVFVDSGTFTNAAYEFVRQVGGVFKCSKGIANYRTRKQSTDKSVVYPHMHFEYLHASQIWLAELNTDYWKQFVHERFLTPTFDENNMLRKGSLSLFELPGRQTHNSFAQHICAEEYVSEFIEGKGSKQYWLPVNENNHFLDATYLACACSESVGVKLIGETPELQARPKADVKTERKKAQPRPHGSSFRTRPGGWVNGARRR